MSILGVPCSDPAFRQEGGGDQIGVIWEPGPHSRSEWEEKPWLMFQQWPLTKMVIYTHIRGVSRMAKVKRDRKCQDDIIILTFANFKLIGFQTFVELKAVASDNILYKLQECWLVVMRFRISIEKHSKFPQALSGGGSVGIIQTCPASLPAWAVRSWQVAGMQNPTNHICWLFTFQNAKS